MKILVIGGTGFIGRHLCPFLATDHQVVVMSRNPPGQEDVCLRNMNISYRSGDITNREQVFSAMKGVDYVVNLASSVIPSTSNQEPIVDVQTNLVGALNILDAAVEYKIKKLIFISSGGTVYGSDVKESFKEGDPTNPICSYGIVKLAVEKYIQMYYHLYGLPYAILRVSNPYGVGQACCSPVGVVSIFIERVMNGKKIEIWGDGSASRDFLYIEDLLDAIEKAIFYNKNNILLNIGCGVSVSLNELVRLVAQYLGQNPEVVYTKKRKLDVKSVKLDVSLAEKTINWTPSTSIFDGIENIIKYYK